MSVGVSVYDMPWAVANPNQTEVSDVADLLQQDVYQLFQFGDSFPIHPVFLQNLQEYLNTLINFSKLLFQTQNIGQQGYVFLPDVHKLTDQN